VPDDLVILGVRPDPEPDQIGTILDRQRAIMQANPDRPERPDLLQVQRRVPRILPEKLVAASAKCWTSTGRCR